MTATRSRYGGRSAHQGDTRGTNHAWSAGLLLAAAAAAIAAGYAFNLWHQIVWYDEVVHGFTIFAITATLGSLALGRVVDDSGDHAVWVVLAIASLGLAVGVLWEVAEWAYDQWAAGNAVKGKTDTIVDLIADTAGAVVGGCLSFAWRWRRR